MTLSVFPRSALAVVLAASLAAAGASEKPTPAEKAGMDEYWRHAPRYGCLCCSVYIPGPKAAAVPSSIGSLPVLQARVYETRGRLACFAAGGKYLFAADDQAVYRIDAARRALAGTYRVTDGLPDSPVRQLAPDGKWVWIVARGRIARLDIPAGRIERPKHPRFAVGRMAAGPAGTFLVTEKGAYRWDAAGGSFQPLGAYPGQSHVARAVERGFWHVQWHNHVSSLLRGVLVGRRELYVLAGNTLSRFTLGGGWSELARDAWRIVLDEPNLWALTTAGLLHHDCRSRKVARIAGGGESASGKPVDLAVAGGAAYLTVEPRFDTREKRYRGGGIGRFDPATGKLMTVGQVGGVGVAFPTVAAADGSDLLVGVRLVGKVEHRSLHPGMANVREYVPKITGLAVAVRPTSGDWQLLRLKGIDGRPCWVMGQQRRFRQDRVRPQHISHLLACGDRLWAVLRNFPENYYGGYHPSVQCIARRTEAGWAAVAERPRVESIGLAGDRPGILCLTATHRKPIVLGHGFLGVLGLLRAADTVWVVHEGGVYAYDPARDEFQAVLTEGFRAYWQVTAGACDSSCVYFGTDAGTITRYDRQAGRFHLLGVVRGRKISRMRIDKGKLFVRTERPKVKATLPAGLSELAELPAADVLCCDGGSWSPAQAKDMPPTPAARYEFQRERHWASNYLAGPAPGDGRPKRLAYLKSVFQPKVLCEDGPGVLWLSVWGGVARLELPDSLAADPRGEMGAGK
jgi:hypothetical protein